LRKSPSYPGSEALAVAAVATRRIIQQLQLIQMSLDSVLSRLYRQFGGRNVATDAGRYPNLYCET
jgi:hypothetical protein